MIRQTLRSPRACDVAWPSRRRCVAAGTRTDGRRAPGARGDTPADERPVVLFVGTSLTAGYGLDPAEAYPGPHPGEARRGRAALPRRERRRQRRDVGRRQSAQCDWLLRQPVAVLVVETGANDGLRGQEPAATRGNIQAIFDARAASGRRRKLVLAAMEALPNYGARLRRRFRAIYPGPREGEQRVTRSLPPGRCRGRTRASTRPTASIPPPRATSGWRRTSGRSSGRCSSRPPPGSP